METNTFYLSDQYLQYRKQSTIVTPVAVTIFLLTFLCFFPDAMLFSRQTVLIALGIIPLLGLLIYFVMSRNLTKIEQNYRMVVSDQGVTQYIQDQKKHIFYTSFETIVVNQTKSDGIVSVDAPGRKARLSVAGLKEMPLFVQQINVYHPKVNIIERNMRFNPIKPSTIFWSLSLGALIPIFVIQNYGNLSIHILNGISWASIFSNWQYALKTKHSRRYAKIAFVIIVPLTLFMLLWKNGEGVIGNSPCSLVGRYFQQSGCVNTIPNAESVAFLPDNKTVVYLDDESIVLAPISGWLGIWTPVLRHDDDVYGYLLSGNGRILVSETFDIPNRTHLWVWDTTTRQLLSKHQLLSITSFNDTALSADGSHIAITRGSEADSFVEIWQIANWQKEATIHGEGPLAFSPDGKYLATMQNDHTIAIIHVASQQIQVTALLPEEDTQDILNLAFSSDNNQLVGQSDYRHNFYVWEFETGTLLKQIGGGEYSSSDQIAISPNGQTLATGVNNKDGQLFIWDLPTGQLHKSVNLGSNYHYGPEFFDFSNDGQRLVVGTHEGGMVFDIESLLK